MNVDPLLGKQLGQYIIQAPLGEGGMARVYKAYHTRLHREDAVKVILSKVAHQPEFKIRFEREAQLAASLEHPNIVRVYDAGDANNLPYLSMQYVGGGVLSSLLRQGYALEPGRAVRYALQMARALHHAHQRGIIHRDVKPQNMLISANDPGQILLSDFGIAKLFDSSHEETRMNLSPAGIAASASLTSIGQIVGTASYMAPEQCEGKEVGPYSDIYALGVVLYQMLTGRLPFQAAETTALMYQHVNVQPRSVRDINPSVSEMLAQIVARALAKDPRARFHTAEEMALALETALTTNQLSTINLANNRPPAIETLTATPFVAAPVLSASSAIPYAPTANIPSLPTNISTAYTPSAPIVIPIPPRRRKLPLVRAVVLTTFLIAIVVLAGKFLSPAGTPLTPAPVPSGAFVDTFKDNYNHWLNGSIAGGLTADVSNNHYTLSYDNEANTHFPYPGSVSQLSSSFTLTTQISQEAGNTEIPYGLAFRMQYSGNQMVSCYAFAIHSSGAYIFMRYDTANGQMQSSVLAQGFVSQFRKGLHQSHQLQAMVKNNTFSFTIDDQAVQLKSGMTLTDATYTDGTLGLLVSGPNSRFVVTRVQFDIPASS